MTHPKHKNLILFLHYIKVLRYYVTFLNTKIQFSPNFCHLDLLEKCLLLVKVNIMLAFLEIFSQNLMERTKYYRSVRILIVTDSDPDRIQLVGMNL